MDKHNANIAILRLLEKYTDDDHKVSQQEMVQLLKKEYGLEIDRRSVKSNIEFLQEAGYEISTEKGYRLQSRTLENAELRVLIDSVLFSKALSDQQGKELISKLQAMGSKYFNMNLGHIAGLQEMQYVDNDQVLESVEKINDAIDTNRKIRFTGSHYGTDFKRHAGGEHIVSPYQIVANNGRFYLICHDDRYQTEEVVYYRLDRMRDVEITKDRRFPIRKVKGMERGLNLPKHMAEHVYMFRGQSVPIKIRTKAYRMDDLVDWFGKDFTIMKSEGDDIIVRLHCNEESFFYWALQYGMTAEVLKPDTLRERLAEATKAMSEKYQKPAEES